MGKVRVTGMKRMLKVPIDKKLFKDTSVLTNQKPCTSESIVYLACLANNNKNPHECIASLKLMQECMKQARAAKTARNSSAINYHVQKILRTTKTIKTKGKHK